jgi:hypothetical protein
MTCMADNVSNVSEVPSEARNLDGVQKARSQIRLLGDVAILILLIPIENILATVYKG